MFIFSVSGVYLNKCLVGGVEGIEVVRDGLGFNECFGIWGGSGFWFW